jgi:diacylglycerol kinase family enzyme
VNVAAPNGQPGDPAAMAADRRRFLVIRNRHAGLDNRRHVMDVAEALAARGARADIVETTSIAELDAALRGCGDAQAVVAAGGDGTLRALARAALASGLAIPIGLIPEGTGNVMAAELQIPMRAATLADILMHAPARTVSVSEANGEPFLAMCGAGFDAVIVRNLSHGLKQRIGRAAYVPPVLKALLARPRFFDVEIDGKPYRTSWIVIANARRYGGGFTIAPEASALVPGLHAVLLHANSRTGRLAELAAIAAGIPHRCPSIDIIACSNVRIAAALPIEIDGDYLAEAPLQVRAATASIRIITPAT